LRAKGVSIGKIAEATLMRRGLETMDSVTQSCSNNRLPRLKNGVPFAASLGRNRLRTRARQESPTEFWSSDYFHRRASNIEISYLHHRKQYLARAFKFRHHQIFPLDRTVGEWLFRVVHQPDSLPAPLPNY